MKDYMKTKIYSAEKYGWMDADRKERTQMKRKARHNIKAEDRKTLNDWR